MRRGRTYWGATVGAGVSSLIPGIWGAGGLSLASLLFFMIGGFVGIWVAYRLFA